jgi:hypothetical protein
MDPDVRRICTTQRHSGNKFFFKHWNFVELLITCFAVYSPPPRVYNRNPRVYNFCLQTPTVSNPLSFKLLEFPEKIVISVAVTPLNKGVI